MRVGLTSHLHPLTLQTKLKTLDVGNNQITTIENISHLSQLEEFWVRPRPSL